MKRVIPVAAVLLCSLSVFAQPTDAIQNWTAPPYWIPPAVSPGNADQSGRSAPATGRQALVTSPVPLPFVAMAPCRQYDSRSTTALADNTPRTVTLIGAPCAIPADAQAVAANITVFNISGAGSNGVFKVGTVSPPTTAWINYPPKETQRANAGVLPLGVGAQWELRCPLARRDQQSRRRSAHQERTPRPSPASLADLRDRPSGCFSNQHWQQPLCIE